MRTCDYVLSIIFRSRRVSIRNLLVLLSYDPDSGTVICDWFGTITTTFVLLCEGIMPMTAKTSTDS